MAKYCCISDFHGNLKFEIPECDVLLIAGDICGPSDIFKQLSFINGPFKKKLENISVPIIFTPGNHDWVFEKCPYFEPTWMKTLIDKSIDIAGTKIYGSPWQPIFFDWAFNLDEEQLERKWSFIPDDTKILLLHGPPHGILDLTMEGVHTGSPSLNIRIEELKELELVVFGHIHNSYGSLTKNFGNKDITFINASLCGEDYKLTRKPIIVEM